MGKCHQGQICHGLCHLQQEANSKQVLGNNMIDHLRVDVFFSDQYFVEAFASKLA